MSTTRRLWLGLAALLIVGFGTLLWMGGEIYRQAPPMPEAVVTADGTTIYTRADIERGRQVWQSIGGQQLGSIWGHGALIAPDWTADGLHREAVAWLDLRAQSAYAKPYDALGEGDRAKLQAELAAIEAESIGWLPMGDGAYLHLGKPDEEEIVITVVGVPEVGMAGMNVLLVG